MIRASGFVFAVVLLAGGIFRPQSQDLRTTGRSLYSSLCERCHGETGDSIGYPGITPLSGITARIPSHEIPRLSAPFVGRTFEGKEAEALIAYLGTLKGEKGFEQPGYLFSPYLLERKLGETRQYRVLDTRPAGEYRAGHIPNAVFLEGDQLKRDARKQLASVGARPETFVVIYDAQGGPLAASAWWAVRRAGHERVAFLDGGYENWTKQGYPVTTTTGSFPSVQYPDSTATPPAAPETCEQLREETIVLGESGPGETRFDWRKTRNEDGLLPASDVRTYLDSVGIDSAGRYALRGTPEERAFLVLILHLTGMSPHVSPAGEFVCLRQ